MRWPMLNPVGNRPSIGSSPWHPEIMSKTNFDDSVTEIKIIMIKS